MAVVKYGSSVPPFARITTTYRRLSCSASTGTFSIIQTAEMHSSKDPTVGGSQILGGAPIRRGGEGVVFPHIDGSLAQIKLLHY